jgi:hypothetical protein
MLIFGGLVHESVRNDLWSMDVRDCTTMTVKTKGDAPMPRVGHAAAIADRIMIVWGGDTKVRPEDPQDEGLYILDLRKLAVPLCQWTQADGQGLRSGQRFQFNLVLLADMAMPSRCTIPNSTYSVVRQKALS